MKKQELLNKLLSSNLLSLAFIGDSVHTEFVREQVLASHDGKMNNYHSQASKYCKAEHQSKVMEGIMHILTQEELDIVKRARNAKPKHHAKNASNADYTYATMFEALVGYLYLSDNTKRLEEILTLSISN